METVYFYESAKDKKIKDILGTDKFMRLSYTTKIGGHNEKIGYHIYVTGSLQELSKLEDEFDVIGIERPELSERLSIIEKFKTDAENAASGMGLIFG